MRGRFSWQKTRQAEVDQSPRISRVQSKRKREMAQRASRLNREGAVMEEATVGNVQERQAPGEGQLLFWGLGWAR